MSTPERALVAVQGVHKRFRLGEHEIHALRGIDLEITPGSFMAIAGASGSGKTTLLNLIGCIDRPSDGRVYFGSRQTSDMSNGELARLRAGKIGFIFQTFNLLPVLTALENVMYPLQLLGIPMREQRARARECLERVGLSRFTAHRPAQLSGGQRQRVAIARAVVKNPELVLADEPTANLDARTAGEVLDLLTELNERDRITTLFSSHDPVVLTRAKRIVHFSDGRVVP